VLDQHFTQFTDAVLEILAFDLQHPAILADTANPRRTWASSELW
jgi:hypothetical protein